MEFTDKDIEYSFLKEVPNLPYRKVDYGLVTTAEGIDLITFHTSYYLVYNNGISLEDSKVEMK